MNPANLQLEGMLMAVAALGELLCRKELVTREELVEAFRQAEVQAARGADRPHPLTPANVEAVLFPLRFLAKAAQGGSDRAFPELAEDIGRGKRDPQQRG